METTPGISLRMLLPLLLLLVLALMAAVWLIKTFLTVLREEKERKWSERQMLHPQYGLLNGELGMWSGSTTENGSPTRFTVGGTYEAPDEGLLGEVSQVSAQLARLKPEAIARLSTDHSEISPAKLRFESIDMLYPERPDHFTLNFHMDGDPDGVWRVEFEQGAAVFSGRDD